MSLRRRLVAAVERFQPVSQELVGILSAQRFPDASTALVIANGTTVGSRALPSILNGRFSSVMVLADTRARAEEARQIVGSNETFNAGTPLSVDLPLPVGFCAILAGPAQMRGVFEELLFEQLPGGLADGALVAVQFCRDASGGILRSELNSPRALETARDFLQSQFATTTLHNDDAIVARFSDDPHYEYLGWCPRGDTDVARASFVWLILRKRPEATNRTTVAARPVQQGISGFPRTPSANQFLLSDFDTMISEMKSKDISLIAVHQFARRLAKVAGRSGDGPPRRPFGLLKFDIHGNIYRPLEMARILTKHSASGLFLMMPKHPLNEHFYDQPSTWRILREIESLGHEIGIHIDPFHLITTFGSLYSGLEAALADFRSRGIAVRCATLHGDSRAHIKERKLQANDFFHDGVRKSKWDGKIPNGEMQLAAHIRAYSHVKLAEEFGITYFPEVNFLREGTRLTRRAITYLSDNQHAFAIRTDSDERHSPSRPYRLDPEFLNKLLPMLTRRPFLALFHPQWYW